MVTVTSRVKPRSGVFATSLDEELVLFDPDAGRYYGAGSVGHEIWHIISAGTSVEDVCTKLVTDFAVDRDTCETDVVAFLSELEQHGLIDVQ